MYNHTMMRKRRKKRCIRCLFFLFSHVLVKSWSYERRKKRRKKNANLFVRGEFLEQKKKFMSCHILFMSFISEFPSHHHHSVSFYSIISSHFIRLSILTALVSCLLACLISKINKQNSNAISPFIPPHLID